MQPFKFDELLKSRAHRILKQLARYQSCVDGACITPDEFLLKANDQLIGIYQNSSTDRRANIYITLNGITFYRDGWQYLAYAEMLKEKVSLASPGEKRSADTLVFHKSSGAATAIQFVSSKADYADVWQVSCFFSRVIADYKRINSVA